MEAAGGDLQFDALVGPFCLLPAFPVAQGSCGSCDPSATGRRRRRRGAEAASVYWRIGFCVMKRESNKGAAHRSKLGDLSSLQTPSESRLGLAGKLRSLGGP